MVMVRVGVRVRVNDPVGVGPVGVMVAEPVGVCVAVTVAVLVEAPTRVLTTCEKEDSWLVLIISRR